MKGPRGAGARPPGDGRVPESRVILALVVGALAGAMAAYATRGPLANCVHPTCPVCQACQACPASGSGGSSAVATIPASGTGPEYWRAAGREKNGDPSLEAVLKRIAINDEVLVAVSNNALISEDGSYGMLATWCEAVKKAGVKNFMVIALDDATAKALDKISVAYWKADPKSLADNNKDNHGISAQKFHLLREFFMLGYSVLLSDVDVAWLQNPFDHLKRDSDVEGLSDGFDERTAYGYIDGIDDPSMGWARYAQTVRIFVLNSGLFYMRASPRSVDLMDKITDHLKVHKDWDQTVFNEKIWYPSHGDYKSAQITVRVMDHLLWMNSKTLFKFQRHTSEGRKRKPIVVHVNYHPEKWERMKAVISKWVNGDDKALDSFPDGSQRRHQRRGLSGWMPELPAGLQQSRRGG